MEITETLYVKNREEWKKWLETNHLKKKEIWLVYYKKHTGKARIPYNDAVDVALCYGWIDSTVKRVDDEVYVQKFTPRRKRSVWSELNRRRALRMIDSGQMTTAGLEKIEEAKRNGIWDQAYTTKKKVEMPEDLRSALEADNTALTFFNSLTASYKNQYINWVDFAKREKTRLSRIKKLVDFCARGIKPGMM